MQIATLNYQYNPKDSFHSNSKTKFQHRHILTTVTNPKKKPKQRQSFLPNVSTNSNASLPPLKSTGKRPNSIRIKGSGILSSKFNDTSTYSFHQLSRSHSRQSDKSDIAGTRSRSITPSGAGKSTSKLVRLKFGYPVKIRSSDFYAPDLTESELRFREESFVNDSIRSAHQTSRSSIIPQYEPLDDPNLRSFFQSSSVSDVVRKTLNVDIDEKPSETKKQSKRNDRDKDYHRIVAKHSSGYAKLNGYDCIPSYAPARHHRLITNDRHRPSANSSLTSFPTHSAIQFQQKKKSHQNNKPKHLAPIATSSPVRRPTGASEATAATSIVTQD